MSEAKAASAPQRWAFAPAKVNLYLHVGALQPDGYHPLVSLMVFADVGDRVGLEVGGAPAASPSLAIRGRFAAGLAHEDPAQNLVVRAAAALFEQLGAPPTPIRLTLDKALPVAAGLGGGSSDAGAALRLVRDTLSPPLDDGVLERVALRLGADGAACLHARPVLARGRGERLSPAPAMPPLPAVLVNPGVACPTGQVYRRFDVDPPPGSGAEDAPPPPGGLASVASVIDWLRGRRNDLEPAACTVAPEIIPLLARLRAEPETALARLSGSGATVFALCETTSHAQALAACLAASEPGWWVRACRLGGPWPTDPAFTNP